MILTFILTLGANLYVAMLSALPTGQLPVAVSGAITTVVSSMYRFNAILPVDTLFQVLAAVIVVELAILAYDAIHWVVRKIPILNIR